MSSGRRSLPTCSAEPVIQLVVSRSSGDALRRRASLIASSGRRIAHRLDRSRVRADDSKAVIARPRGELERLASNDNQVFGAQGQFTRAAEAYKQIPTKTPPIIADLLEELRCRFVDRSPPQHDDAWLIQRELDYELTSV